MRLLDIGEVAEQAGLPPSTLRYYEELGLIEAVGRRGLRRQFGPETLLQLAFIALGRTAGFSLGEIAGMFGGDGRPAPDRAELHARADALEQQIKRMKALRDALRHTAECPAPSHLECPTFQRLMKAATKRNALDRRRHKRRAAKTA